MKKVKTTMEVVCAWCKKPMGTKDGGGVTGTTHGICPACAAKEWAKLGGRPPARWNLVGRWLYRRRQARERLGRLEREHDELEKFDGQVNERAALEELFATNPALHTRIMLQGKRGVHYLMPEDLAGIEKAVADQPEIRCKWN